jgi:flagellar biosynthetic protein FliR
VTAEDAALVAALPAWAFAFMLVLSRVSAAVMVMPGIGETELPATVRAALALCITVLLLPVTAPLLPAAPDQFLPAAGMIAAEIITGLWLGWLARLLMLALPMAGQFISYQVGLSNVLQMDMSEGAETTDVSQMLGYAAPLIILVSGLYALPLEALAGSFEVIAPGGLLAAGDASETLVRAVEQSFALSLRLAAPFVVAGMVWQVSIGLLSRLVPSLQVFLVHLPGQILGGLLLMGALIGAVLGAWGEAVRAGLSALPGLH